MRSTVASFSPLTVLDQSALNSLRRCILVLAFGLILFSEACRPHEDASNPSRDTNTKITGDESKSTCVRLVGTVKFPHSWLSETGIGIPMKIGFEERTAWRFLDLSRREDESGHMVFSFWSEETLSRGVHRYRLNNLDFFFDVLAADGEVGEILFPEKAEVIVHAPPGTEIFHLSWGIAGKGRSYEVSAGDDGSFRFAAPVGRLRLTAVTSKTKLLPRRQHIDVVPGRNVVDLEV